MSIDIEEALRAEFASRADRATASARPPYPGLERRITRQRRARTGLTAAALVVAIGTGAGVALGTSDDPTTPAATGTVVGGCGTTPLQLGNPPAWTAIAHPPKNTPYVVSEQGNAVGFVFTNPLHGGPPGPTSNKVLWVVRTSDPVSGPLAINAAAPQGTSATPVTHQEPGIGGGAYPSITDVPVPGCWHFTLTWGKGKATAYLPYT